MLLRRGGPNIDRKILPVLKVPLRWEALKTCCGAGWTVKPTGRQQGMEQSLRIVACIIDYVLSFQLAEPLNTPSSLLGPFTGY